MRRRLSLASLLLCWLSALAVGPSAWAEPPGSARPGPKGLQVSLDTDRTSYRTGQPVQFRLRLTNATAQQVTFRFNSGQRFDVTVFDQTRKVVWRWAVGQMFAQVLGEETLQPGEFRSYAVAFTGTLPAGTYWARGDIVVADGPLSDWTVFTVKESPSP